MGPPAPRGQVEFRTVAFKYQAGGTGEDVLSGIDLTIHPGEFLAVVGGTGTGKSSLVNLIPRFYAVTGGAGRALTPSPPQRGGSGRRRTSRSWRSASRR